MLQAPRLPDAVSDVDASSLFALEAPAERPGESQRREAAERSALVAWRVSRGGFSLVASPPSSAARSDSLRNRLPMLGEPGISGVTVATRLASGSAGEKGRSGAEGRQLQAARACACAA